MLEITSCGEVSGRVQSVLLLTDGNANKGIRKADDILSEMKKTVREHNHNFEFSKCYAKCVYLHPHYVIKTQGLSVYHSLGLDMYVVI